uniref:Uncharacterized protein n=1 Tax=Crocodylus porosus TaxID=8502 RepID=A0A7M4F291_CROPO
MLRATMSASLGAFSDLGSTPGSAFNFLCDWASHFFPSGFQVPFCMIEVIILTSLPLSRERERDKSPKTTACISLSVTLHAPSETYQSMEGYLNRLYSTELAQGRC